MWRRLPDHVVQERTAAIAKTGLPKFVRAILATVLFGASLYAISFMDGYFKGQEGNQGLAFKLQNASLSALVAVFAVTAIFMYFLFVKNRKVPVIFICYDCQEAFHVAATCPECGSSNISDIRLAEWIEK